MKNTLEFGRRIKELRLINDYSLRDLAAKCSVSYSFISSIEKGRFSPSRDTVISLSDALEGADMNRLLLLAGFAPVESSEQQYDYKTDTRLSPETIEIAEQYEKLPFEKQLIIKDIIRAYEAEKRTKQ